jgi:hypothetical protein
MAGNKNSGRPSKGDEQKMIEKLTVYTDDVYEVLHKNIKLGKQWAIALWFNRMYGRSRESKELDIKTNEVPLFNIILDDNSNEI